MRWYVFDPYRMVKEDRSQVERGDIKKVMDGELDPFIEGYLTFQMGSKNVKS